MRTLKREINQAMNRNDSTAFNRRDFLKISAATAVATALAGTPFVRNGRVVMAQSGNAFVDVLNYALTLEHLEARAYKDVIASGLLSGQVLQYFQTFGAHEAAHVDALTSTIQSLGGTPVQAQASYNWPAFANQQEVLMYFHTVEELGAAAYLGAAPSLIDNDDLLTAAVSIHNVEGQHAAVLSDLIGVSPSPAFAEAKTMAQVLEVVTPILTVATVPAGMPSTGRGGAPTRQTINAGTRSRNLPY